jgi:hypothetical protein
VSPLYTEDRFGASRGATARGARRLLRLKADQAVWIVLADGRLAAKTPVCEGWKSLDFLGFSRVKRAFSMRYTGFSLKKISRALWPERDGIGGMGAGGLGVRRAGLLMGRA